MAVLGELAEALRSGSVEVIDLTAPLVDTTPILLLPEPFANTSRFRLEQLSRYDERGPGWYWNDIHTGEHTGTHLDAPVHWVTGRDGLDVSQAPLSTLVAPAVVIDMTARVRNDARWDLGLSPEACAARSLAIRDDYESFAFSAGQAIFAQPVADAQSGLATWVSREFARNDPAAMAAVWESLVAQDMRVLLGSIRHPTLIVHGAHSSLYGDGTADHLVAALPEARALRFERSGHAPHLEEPDLFNATLTDFAGRLSRARAAQTTE